MSAWWSDERIRATVTREYISDRLPTSKQGELHRPLAFGDGLTDDTYLDWILLRGKRLFLIFEDIRLPECIFEAVDGCLDDNDLPLSEEAIADLNLPGVKASASGKAFYRRQFKYIVRELHEGCHVDYEAEEIVPVEPLAKRSGILPSQNVEKVIIGNSLCIRRRVLIEGNQGVDRIHFLLHLKSLMSLKHPHLITVLATYTQGLHGYVLSTPCLEVTLKSFLEDPPKSFKSLAKSEKRGLLLQWIHCLSDAIAYLHEQGHAHQAIRPSNIFIDSQNHIYLGESAALDALEGSALPYDRESYEYASPEQWRRKPVLQEINPLRATLPGGGRTGRRLPKSKPNSDLPSSASPSPALMGAATHSVSSPSTVSGASHNPRSSVATSVSTAPSTAPTTHSSTTSSSSSGTSTIRKRALITTFAAVSLPTLLPSDIFSLSAIHLHLLSALFSLASSSHSASKFSAKSLRSHLSKHNRSAGRGGAPADSSFHANLAQVGSWLDKLRKEGHDKMKGGEDDAIWEVVGKLTDVLRMGMAKDWSERWEARKGERRICSLVLRWGGCCGGNGQGPLPSIPQERMNGRSNEEDQEEEDESEGALVFDNSSSIYSLEEEPRDGHARGDWILPEHFPVAPLQQKMQPTVRTDPFLQDRPNLSRIPTAQLRAELENRHVAKVAPQTHYYDSNALGTISTERIHPAYRSSHWPLQGKRDT
ncbi:MAG: hypothetical protein Q9187_001798 [Circinaria calcarea]